MSRKISMPKRSRITLDEISNNVPKSQIDLLELARLVLRRRRWVVSICSLVVAATTTYMLLQPNLYTSKAMILPSGGGTNYSSLRAFMGMAAGMDQSDENSSSLFPVIIGSDLVVKAVLEKDYWFKADNQFEMISLPEYFNLEDPDKLKKALRTATSVSTDARTSEMTVSVETTSPGLSQAVLKEYLAQLEAFNLHKRRSQAKENQRYLEDQLSASAKVLLTAEEELTAFREANRNWATTSTPKILTHSMRLVREVELRSRAHLILQEQYELAKLEAQKDIPIVRILDQPSLPTQKSGPFRRNIIILSGLISFGLTILGIFIIDLVQQAVRGNNRQGFDQLCSELAEAFPRSARRLAARRFAAAPDEVTTIPSQVERVPVGAGAEQDI